MPPRLFLPLPWLYTFKVRSICCFRERVTGGLSTRGAAFGRVASAHSVAVGVWGSAPCRLMGQAVPLPGRVADRQGASRCMARGGAALRASGASCVTLRHAACARGRVLVRPRPSSSLKNCIHVLQAEHASKRGSLHARASCCSSKGNNYRIYIGKGGDRTPKRGVIAHRKVCNLYTFEFQKYAICP